MTRQVYVDNNATTMCAPEVVEEMLPFFRERYGNPSSIHTFGSRISKDLDTARKRVAALFGCTPTEIVFTSCGTESNNYALRGAALANPQRTQIITTMVEHPAVLTTCRSLQRRGYSVLELPVDGSGRLNLDRLAESITDQTLVVSIMHANNETGTVFPIAEIGTIVKERGALFHVDAVQAPGKLSLSIDEIPADMISVSAHKFHGPKGVGALYVRRGTRLIRFMTGGHQERGRRGGTENVPGIVGMGKAAELALASFEEENTFVTGMRDRMERGLLERIPHCSVNGDPENRLPNTSNIGFEFIEGEAILLMMDREGISASSGSACTSGSLEPSHVLRAMGVDFKRMHGSIRFSLSRYNTEEDVDYLLDKMPPLIERLREISPFGSQVPQPESVGRNG
jgi:cysteine desulfurase